MLVKALKSQDEIVKSQGEEPPKDQEIVSGPVEANWSVLELSLNIINYYQHFIIILRFSNFKLALSILEY